MAAHLCSSRGMRHTSHEKQKMLGLLPPPNRVVDPGALTILNDFRAATSASPTACTLRGYGRAGTQNDRLGEAAILSTGTRHTRAMDMPPAMLRQSRNMNGEQHR